jgi:hypothetical protein
MADGMEMMQPSSFVIPDKETPSPVSRGGSSSRGKTNAVLFPTTGREGLFHAVALERQHLPQLAETCAEGGCTE